ncbi:MAG: VanZ family protein [Muribaculaceae bacterium]|nr:VanZ family protein [Muribaculaceae bacterium]
MNKFLTRLPAWTFTVVIMAAICYLTLVPRPLPDIDMPMIPGLDKVVHGIMFGALAGAICLDVARKRGLNQLTVILLAIAFVVASLAGGAIELLQSAMNQGRSCELPDFVADVAGALLAVMVARPVCGMLLRNRPQ